MKKGTRILMVVCAIPIALLGVAMTLRAFGVTLLDVRLPQELEAMYFLVVGVVLVLVAIAIFFAFFAKPGNKN